MIDNSEKCIRYKLSKYLGKQMDNLKVKSHSFPMPGNSNDFTIIFPSDPLHGISWYYVLLPSKGRVTLCTNLPSLPGALSGPCPTATSAALEQ